MKANILNAAPTPDELIPMIKEVAGEIEEVTQVNRGMIVKFSSGLMLQAGFYGPLKTTWRQSNCTQKDIGSGQTASVCESTIPYFVPFVGYVNVLAVIQEGINLNNDGQAIWLQTGKINSEDFSIRLIDFTGGSGDVGISWVAWGVWK